MASKYQNKSKQCCGFFSPSVKLPKTVKAWGPFPKEHWINMYYHCYSSSSIFFSFFFYFSMHHCLQRWGNSPANLWNLIQVYPFPNPQPTDQVGLCHPPWIHHSLSYSHPILLMLRLLILLTPSCLATSWLPFWTEPWQVYETHF